MQPKGRVVVYCTVVGYVLFDSIALRYGTVPCSTLRSTVLPVLYRRTTVPVPVLPYCPTVLYSRRATSRTRVWYVQHAILRTGGGILYRYLREVTVGVHNNVPRLHSHSIYIYDFIVPVLPYQFCTYPQSTLSSTTISNHGSPSKDRNCTSPLLYTCCIRILPRRNRIYSMDAMGYSSYFPRFHLCVWCRLHEWVQFHFRPRCGQLAQENGSWTVLGLFCRNTEVIIKFGGAGIRCRRRWRKYQGESKHYSYCYSLKTYVGGSSEALDG